MRKPVIGQSLIVIAVIILTTSAALADRREIVLTDSSAEIRVSRESLGLAFDNQVGVAVTFQDDSSFHLRTFLVKEGKSVDDIDLKPEFGLRSVNDFNPFVVIKVHSGTGLVIAYGVDSDETQKVLAYQADQQGHLRPLWKLSFPQSFIPLLALNINKDGSRICLLYRDSRDSTVHTLILDSQDGSVLNSAIIGRVEFTANVETANVAPADLRDFFFTGWIDFDEIRQRVVATAGDSVYLLTPRNGALVIESQISAPSNLGVTDLFIQAFSQDRRFLLAVYGYRIKKSVKKNEFVYISFDLEAKTSSKVLIKSQFTTQFNPTTFHAPTGNLLIPLSVSFEVTRGRLSMIRDKSRFALILNLTQNGALLKKAEVTIPEQSPQSDSLNIIGESSGIEVTAGGALALLPTANGRLFMFDTATGEVVNDVEVNSNGGLVTTKLLESSNSILFSTDKSIFVFDVELGPIVNSVEVKERRTIIRGANFLSGVRVEIDGRNIEGISRDSDAPGREIIIERGKDDFPVGQEFTLAVVNRDNRSSALFKFRR